MEEYPKTLLEFEKCFVTEEACQAYLLQIRWPDGVICSRCGHHKFWSSKTEKYRCRRCKHRVFVTSGTIFQDSRIPLRIWF